MNYYSTIIFISLLHNGFSELLKNANIVNITGLMWREGWFLFPQGIFLNNGSVYNLLPPLQWI